MAKALREKFYVLMDEETGSYLYKADHCRFATGQEFALVPTIHEARTYETADICSVGVAQANRMGQNHNLVIAEISMALEIL